MQALRVIEPDAERPAFPRGLAIQRTTEWKIRFSVSQGASSQGKPCAHRLLIRRVHIVALSHVQGDGHAGIDYVQGAPLAIANQLPNFLSATRNSRSGQRETEGSLGATAVASQQ